ncbi:aspartyl protease family protein [Vulcanisaeta sp. JCM 16159]|uniref:aspartyl protease family protein n=1 Tax=Vulcanisaeta sp. JCM 16159 TaxID=1295371 RepID=UPI0006D1C684|nr:aspartyl protease family protein [Vulcanisaeta sp. JCM 16159]
MGFIRVRAKVWSVDRPSEPSEVELVVDTGSVYTVLPAKLLNELGVKPMGLRRFKLADGRIIERSVGVVGIEVQGIRAHTMVVFGDEGIYLLGATTLEELGLEVDPVNKTLRPTELLLM